jgi:hypothetical protein
MEILELQAPGTFRPCPCLYRDCFTFYLLLKLEIPKPLKNISCSNHVNLPAIEITMKNRTNSKYFDDVGYVIVMCNSRNITRIVD